MEMAKTAAKLRNQTQITDNDTNENQTCLWHQLSNENQPWTGQNEDDSSLQKHNNAKVGNSIHVTVPTNNKQMGIHNV